MGSQTSIEENEVQPESLWPFKVENREKRTSLKRCLKILRSKVIRTISACEMETMNSGVFVYKPINSGLTRKLLWLDIFGRFTFPRFFRDRKVGVKVLSCYERCTSLGQKLIQCDRMLMANVLLFQNRRVIDLSCGWHDMCASPIVLKGLKEHLQTGTQQQDWPNNPEHSTHLHGEKSRLWGCLARPPQKVDQLI